MLTAGRWIRVFLADYAARGAFMSRKHTHDQLEKSFPPDGLMTLP